LGTDMRGLNAPLGVEDSTPGAADAAPAGPENPVNGFSTAAAERFGADPPQGAEPLSATP